MMKPKHSTRTGGGGEERRAVVPILLIVCVAHLGLSRAAERPPDPDLDIRGMRSAGPFHIKPFVALKHLGYDDNIRFVGEDPEGDTTATAGPGLRTVMLFRDRGGLHLSQQLDYVAFGTNTDLNHWNGDLRARGVLLLKTVALSLEDRFTSQRERPNTEIDRRLRRENHAATAALRTLRRGRFALKATARHETIEYDNDGPETLPIAERLNRDERSLFLEGELRLLPKTAMILEGRVRRSDFRDDAEGRDSRQNALLAGFRFDPSASVQGEFKFGVLSLDAPDRPGSDFRGTIGEAHLTKRLGHAARLRASYERDIVFSTSFENLYFVGTSWSAAYEQFLTRRFSAELLYGRGLNHYPIPIQRTATPAFEGLRDDRLETHQVTLRFHVNSQLSITTSASRLRRDSSDDLFDRERRFYAVGSVYNF
jgi:hypothetical protein